MSVGIRQLLSTLIEVARSRSVWKFPVNPRRFEETNEQTAARDESFLGTAAASFAFPFIWRVRLTGFLPAVRLRPACFRRYGGDKYVMNDCSDGLVQNCAYEEENNIETISVVKLFPREKEVSAYPV